MLYKKARWISSRIRECMRILVVSQHCWPEPFNVLETCELLQQLGHEVTVLTGLPNYPQGAVQADYRHRKNRVQEKNGVTIIRSWLYPRGANLSVRGKIKRVINYFSFALAASRRTLLKGHRFDLVICLQFSPVLMAVPALLHARRLKVPCLIYVFDLWPEDMLAGGIAKDGFLFKIMAKASKFIYSRADAIMGTSPDFRRYFADELRLKNTMFYFLPQYAEALFEDVERSTQVRENNGINIVFAGNVGANQAIDNVVRAAALLADRCDIRIQIIGSGSMLEECKSLAQELGVDNITFLGRLPLEDMPKCYARADALLLPLAEPTNGSLVASYTIPRKFQSYIAAGRPIICAANGVVSKLVKENSIGVACAAGDPAALAAAIVEFADRGASEAAEMGKRARELYEEQFSRARFVERLSETLRLVTR